MPAANSEYNTLQINGLAPLLHVFDMPVCIAFYRDKLGFKIVGQSEPELGDDCNWVWLKRNNVELMFNTAYEKKNRPAVADPLRIKAHADTVIYFGCPDIDALYAHLHSKGLDIKEPIITMYHFKAIYLTDPDGYHLCFHWPL